MAMNDLLSDMLTRIRNAQAANLSVTHTHRYSKLLANVCEVMKKEGFIRDWKKTGDEKKPGLEIQLKYHEGKPVIHSVERVSTSGRRRYASVDGIPRVNNGLGIAILSTSRGVMSDYEARQANVGGEVLCNVS